MYLQQLTPPVIHRDIKPQNLIRQDNGRIFLVDFGAVQDTYNNSIAGGQDTYNNSIAGGSTVVGTFGYMAPEQFRGQAVLSTDLYGLGTTLLFLLTGKSPADLPHHQLTINFHSAVQLPKRFAAWLERMIEPISTARFPSAVEALVVLQGKQPLPPRASTFKQPKNSKIQLLKATDKMIVDIPPTLLNSPQSLCLGLSLLLAGIFSVCIFNALIAQVLEPLIEIEPGKELLFRLCILLMVVFPVGFGICLFAAESLLFSSGFRTRIQIKPFWSIQMTWFLGALSVKNLPIKSSNKLQVSLTQIQHSVPSGKFNSDTTLSTFIQKSQLFLYPSNWLKRSSVWIIFKPARKSMVNR